MPPHRHCERSEAIHLSPRGNMDCFVATLLAMTEKAEGREILIVPDTTIVPSGVVQLMELAGTGLELRPA